MAAHPQRPKDLVDLQIHPGSPERLQMADMNADQNRHSLPDDVDNESDEGGEMESTLLASEFSPGYTPLKRPTNDTRSYVRGILLETVPTLLLTTVGLTFTGELLERVALWRATKRVNELYILIPMLNNLKGNLEMILSSRLSTSANVGDLDDRLMRRQLVWGNLCLIQVQALVISAIAALLSFLLGLVISPTAESSSMSPSMLFVETRKLQHTKPLVSRDGSKSGLREFAVLLSTSMASASISGLILGSFMCALILICLRLHRNPDNITPPIASCLGDLLTLCIIGFVSTLLVSAIDSAIPFILMVVLSLSTVFAIMTTLRNEFVRHLIFLGWTPLLGAMVISSGAGMVLESFVDRYEAFGLLSIVLGGLPGAVGSVLISRLSTSLHASPSTPFHPGDKPPRNPRTFVTIITLFLITFPVLGLFLIYIHVMNWTKLPFLFISIFVVMFCATVFFSLVAARVLTQYLWRRGIDPDSYAMPIHSSALDLLGNLMLVLCYEMAQALGADVKIKP